MDIYAWALANAGRLWAAYQSDAILNSINDLGLNDRASDVWLPIFSLAATLPISEADCRALSELAISMGVDPDREEDRQRLAIVRGLIAIADGADIVLDTTESLMERLQRHGVKTNRDRFHEVMAILGVEQTSNRIAGEPRRSWRVPLARPTEVERELAVLGPVFVTTPTTENRASNTYAAKRSEAATLREEYEQLVSAAERLDPRAYLIVLLARSPAGSPRRRRS